MLIREYMTKSSLGVARDTPLAEARDILRRHDIRHLPVLEGEKLVGILSERNVLSALAAPGGEKFLAEDAMLPDVFAVDPDADLAAVAEKMADEKYGCAVIREKNGKVAGLFTTVDACRLLAEQLKGKSALEPWRTQRSSSLKRGSDAVNSRLRRVGMTGAGARRAVPLHVRCGIRRFSLSVNHRRIVNHLAVKYRPPYAAFVSLCGAA